MPCRPNAFRYHYSRHTAPPPPPPAIYPQPITSNFPVLGVVRTGKREREGGKAVVGLKQTHMALFTNRRLFSFAIVTRHWHWLARCFESETARGGVVVTVFQSVIVCWVAWTSSTRDGSVTHKVPQTHACSPANINSAPPPQPLQHRLPSACPTSVWLPEIQLSETGDAMGEEQPDSPELECQPFPQETWSISNEGALDRPLSAHTYKSANRTSYDNRSVKQTKYSALNVALKTECLM